MSEIVGEQRRDQERRKEKAGTFVLGPIPPDLMNEIHRSQAAAVEYDGNVEDRSESQLQDRTVVVEGGLDVRGAGAAKDFHFTQDLIGPHGLHLLLSAAHRIGRGHIRVDPLNFGTTAVEAHNRKESMPDGLSACPFYRLANAERLVRSA